MTAPVRARGEGATASWQDSGDPGLPLLRVDHGPLRATFLPAVGGRLISLAYAGHEFLWINPGLIDPLSLRLRKPRTDWPVPDGSFAGWANVGGAKTWPAPQGWSGPDEWAGPPDPVLDAGSYQVRVVHRTDTLDLILTSPNDPRTGLRIERTFTFGERLRPIQESGAAFFQQHITFTNTSATPRRWAIWEVVQIGTAAPAAGATGLGPTGPQSSEPGAGPTAAQVQVPLVVPVAHAAHGSNRSVVVDLGRYAGHPVVHVEHGVATLPIGPGIAKFGFPTAVGSAHWMAPDAPRLTLSTVVDVQATYPDQGSRVELWTQSPVDEPILDGWCPDAWLVELELLGPLRVIGPGERTEMVIDWQIG